MIADRVGFEPTSLLRDYLISSQGRYDHFDTCPYAKQTVRDRFAVCRVIISDARRKIKCVFDRKFIYNLQIYLYNYIDKVFGGAIIDTD